MFFITATLLSRYLLVMMYSPFSRQKTLNMKNEDAFVKEDYMDSRKRTTLFTQVSTDEDIELPLEFVFKGVGKD